MISAHRQDGRQRNRRPFRRVAARIVLIILLSGLCGQMAVPCVAQETPARAVETTREAREKAFAEIQALKQRILREEGRLSSLKKRETEILASRDEVEKQLSEIGSRKTNVSASMVELDSLTVRVEESISITQRKVDLQRDLLERRIVALYKTRRRISSLSYLGSAGSATELLKRTRLLIIIGESDRRRLADLAQSVELLDRERRELKEVKSRREQALAELDSLESDLAVKRFQHASLITEAKKQLELQESSVSKLRRELGKLEIALSALMGGDEENSVVAGETEEEAIASGDPTVIAEPYVGPGLRMLQGALNAPVEGAVIRRFGAQTHDEFSDKVFSKGLEYRSAPGAQVRSVAPGKVVLTNALPGFGNVLIVDHGSRYYTLYGRLLRVSRRVGDVLKAGDVLGVVSDKDSRGRSFYFELRVRGKAVDPVGFLRSRPKFVES